MKRLLLVLLATITFAANPMPTHASPNDFTFTSFNADYYIGKDAEGRSTLAVTETLKAEFPDIDQNHGIERALPARYNGHPLSLTIQSVTDANKAALKYTTYNSNDNTVVRIGDANSYVHGTQTYIIRYAMRDVTTTQNGSQEFFWNINGTQWQQPFGTVSARVHLDPSIVADFDERTVCYTGAQGSTEQNCQVGLLDETNTIAVISNESLQATENLSVAIGFKPDSFAAYVAPPIPVWVYVVGAIITLLVIATQIIAPIWLLRYAYRTWKKWGRDVNGRGTIIPEYSKPVGYSMPQNSIALNETVSPTAISATFIDLAIRGYLTINDMGKKTFQSTIFDLKIIKPVDDLPSEEKDVLRLLFGSLAVGETASTKTHRSDASQKIAALQKSSYDNMVKQNLFLDNTAETAKLKIWGLIFTIGSFFIAGFFSLLAGIITLIFVSKMPARTASGVSLRDHLLGNKLYMQVAETDRIQTLQSVTGAERINTSDGNQIVKLYEKLLPLAIIFGIEKEWAKQFAAISSNYQPSWYNTANNSALNAALLGTSLSSFTSTLTYSTFAAPSSSGGSGFSGGSSGGGGGGGGGGGW